MSRRRGWKAEKLRALHELGRAFGLTEDAQLTKGDEQKPPDKPAEKPHEPKR